MSAQVAADLRAAADVLERDGWTWGAYKDATGHCAIGAIRVAASGRTDISNVRALDAIRAAEREVRWRPLHEWNDLQGRTAAEVIAALRAAADRAEAETDA